MSQTRDTITAFRTRLTRMLFLTRWLKLCAFWGFAAGTLVLAMRFGHWPTQPMIAIFFCGCLALMLPALRLARRNTPSEAAVGALLDNHNRGGGLVMAHAETDLGNWPISPLTTPGLNLPVRDLLARCLAPVAFLMLAWLVPTSWIEPQPQPLDISKELTDLEEKLAMLEQYDMVTKQQKETYEKTLQELEAEAQGDDPQRTWESLDHLSDTLAERGEEGGLDMQDMAEQLNAVNQLGQSLEEMLPNLAPELSSQAMTEFQQMLEEMSSESQAFQQALSDMEWGEMDSQQMQQMGEGIDSAMSEMENAARQLNNQQLISDRQMQNIQDSLNQQNSEGELADFLEGLPTQHQALGQVVGKLGEPGIDRGPGAAPLNWLDPSTHEDYAFTEQVLSPKDKLNFRNSRRIGTGLAAPVVQPDGTGGQDRLGQAQAGGGAAYTHRILPRHKGAVQKYFQKEPAK